MARLDLPESPPPRLDDQSLWAVLRRLPAWVALIVSLMLMFFRIAGHSGPRDALVAAEWQATITAPDGRVSVRPVTLPASFASLGIPPDARVSLTRTVVADGRGSALWVDHPRWAIAARWEGSPIGAVGDPSREGDAHRSGASLFAPIPPAPAGTAQVIELDLRGDYGEGGVFGRVLIGPAAEVHHEALWGEAQRLGLVLAGALLAALLSFVASRGARRPAYVLYGLFAASFSAGSLVQTDLWMLTYPHALTSLRLFRGLVAVSAVLGVGFVAMFVQGRLRLPEWLTLAAGAALAVAAWCAPPDAMPVVERGTYMALAATLVLVGWRAVNALERRVPGASLLGLGVLASYAFVPLDIFLARGHTFALSAVGPLGLLLLVSFAGALLLRDARASEDHELLTSGSLDAMLAVDAEGTVLWANLSATNRVLRPIPPATETALELLDQVAEAERHLVRHHLTRALAEPDLIEFRSHTGTVFESIATPIARGRVMVTLRDVTHKRALDRAMQHAARVEIAGTLLGGVAHDFNNTLQLIIAHIDMLRMTAADPAVLERYRLMEAAVDRASNLTKRMLTVARGSNVQLGTVNLEQVVNAAIDLVEPRWPKGVTLTVALRPNPDPVLGSEGDLTQALVNLLVNALEAVGKQGRVRITARPFGAGENSRGTVLMVEDDGPGIPEDRREEVFQPFVTWKSKGSGLGLAVARQMLRDHQGRLWVEDNPEGGARFLLAVWNADAAEATSEPLPNARKVTLVEDEPALLEVYRQALQRSGYEVTAFSSSVEAAQHLEHHRPDLLVTDLMMPEVNGVRLAEVVERSHRDVPVLFVSAFVPHEAVRHLNLDLVTTLHKPAPASLLVSMVGRVLRRWERRQEGIDEISRVRYIFPDISALDGATLGFDRREEDAGYARVVFPRPRDTGEE